MFIVGAAKSGTTSLAHYLDQHPQIFITPIKEPFYFVQGTGIETYEEYLDLFQGAGAADVIGDASTGYLFEEGAAKRINESFGGSKVIIMLRDPVEMAFSYWQYMFLIGNESKSFEEAISEEARRYRSTEEFRKQAVRWWASYLYLERASYYLQLKAYLETFGPERVRVCIFEEFYKDPKTACRELFTFLGVDERFIPKFKKVNEGGEMRSLFLRYLRNREFPLLKKITPITWRYKARGFLLRLNIRKGKKSRMSPFTRERLIAYFRDDVRNVEHLLGRPITQWQSSEGYRTEQPT